MTGEEFVKHCFAQQDQILAEYFAPDTRSAVGRMIRSLMEAGTDREALYALLGLALKENCYTLLLALDGCASLNGTQTAFRLYDEEGHLLNGCGEIEAAAYQRFMEAND